jgi:hypothetical protein
MENVNAKISKNIDQYIELVYSEKSDLNKIIDLQERKKQACAKAKLNFNDEAIQLIVNMKDEKVNIRIFEYLTTQNSNEFILLLSDQHLFLQMQQRLMEPLAQTANTDSDLKDLDLKTKISEKSESLLDRMTSRYLKIFKGSAEQDFATQKVRLMRPEERIKKKPV